VVLRLPARIAMAWARGFSLVLSSVLTSENSL
jgi:hypothetical protein